MRASRILEGSALQDRWEVPESLEPCGHDLTSKGSDCQCWEMFLIVQISSSQPLGHDPFHSSSLSEILDI